MEKLDDKGPISAQGANADQVELKARAAVLDIVAAEVRLAMPPELVAELAQVFLTAGMGPAGVASFAGRMFRGMLGAPRGVRGLVAGIKAAREACG